MKYRKLVVPEKYKVELTETEYDFRIEKPTEVIVKAHYSHISAGTELACLGRAGKLVSHTHTPGYTSVGEVGGGRLRC
ncbi:MAG: hypothetical protein HC842_06355 [Cytophagales bacterium]|nr:hypothetical protein [Cytophagales bacterium]